MSRPLPSAELVAAIILAAASECGENPQEVLDGKSPSRARIYAFVGLRERCRQLSIKDAGMLCFAPHAERLRAEAQQAMAQGWWSGARLARVSTATPRRDKPEAPVPAAPAPKPKGLPPAGAALRRPEPRPPASIERPVAYAHEAGASAGRVEIVRHAKPAPALCLNPVVRRAPPARSGVSVTAETTGDPAPGRSALDQKRAAAAQGVTR